MFGMNSQDTSFVVVLTILALAYTVNNLINQVADTRRTKHHHAVEVAALEQQAQIPVTDGEELDENAEVPA